MTGPFSVRRATRFARAIDPGPRALKQVDPPQDEETARLVELTDRLRTADFDGTPSPEFRERLRAQLLVLAETQLPATPPPRKGPGRHALRGLARGGGSRPGSPSGLRSSNPRLAVLAGALSALVACSGLTVVVSGRSLPGDTLYSLKRTTETVELALAHGEEAKAQRHLDFAQARARELADLVRRGLTDVAATQGPSDGSEPFVATIDDMDEQTTEGARALTEFAVDTVSDPALVDLGTWTADQRAILEPVVERLHGDAGTRVRRSAALLGRIRDRVAALRVELTCTCMDRTHGDDLGPLPCWPCNPRTLPAPQGGTTPGSLTGGPRQGPNSPAPTHSTAPAVTSGSSPPGSTPTGGAPPPTTPPPSDPSLLPPVTGDPTGGGGLLPPILPTGVLPPLLPGLLPGLFGG